MSFYTIVPAAGEGTRLGKNLPKALVQIKGKTILTHTLERLGGSVDGALQGVVLAPEDQKYFQQFTDEVARFCAAAPGSRLVVVPGGETRRISVLCGISALSEHFSIADDALVAVHDAARCLLSAEDLTAVITAAKKSGAATLATPMVDSLIEGQVLEEAILMKRAIPREKIWAVQTPQVFLYYLLAQAHEANIEATDDASLVAKIHPVQIVQTTQFNGKITIPSDLKYAEEFL